MTETAIPKAAIMIFSTIRANNLPAAYSRSFKILLAVLGLVALFTAGLAIRRVVLAAQFEQYGRPLQFNLESALEFRYVRMLFETGHIPRLDKAVQAPEGVVVRETYTIGAEYVYAAASRLFPWLSLGRPRSIPLDERVRWIAAAWFCLGIPLMSLWLWAWTRSIWAAGIAGAYYAVALAAVMRSTGQELQHENFALPFLIAHWALGALANRTKGRSVLFYCGPVFRFNACVRRVGLGPDAVLRHPLGDLVLWPVRGRKVFPVSPRVPGMVADPAGAGRRRSAEPLPAHPHVCRLFCHVVGLRCGAGHGC